MIAELLAAVGLATTSPDGRASVDFSFGQGRVSFAVSYDGKPMATLVTGEGWRTAECVRAATPHENWWKPVWGEQERIRDASAQAFYRAVDDSGRPVEIETRIYDEGFAFRCRLPKGGSFPEKTSVNYPNDARAWAIATTEATYPQNPLPFAAGAREWMTPLTTVSSAGYASFFDAYAVGYPRLRVVPRKGGADVKLLQREVPVLQPGGTTPWRVLQLGASAANLIDHASLVLNLNPPCVLRETAWIRPGLTLSNLSNCPLKTDEILKMARAEQATGAKYVQLDWGWYGTEWGWSDADREKFVQTNPEMANESTWRGNTSGNARQGVKGIVPYLPGWKRQFEVDFNPEQVIAGLRKLGMSLCLYVRGPVLEKENLDDLFALYERWGVAGVKPGFVRYGSAADTDWNRRLVETAARHHLWVDIHDADIPDGMQRTYPNLFLMEGVGGEEGRHPVHQDVTIPFARGLIGPFDYTPMVFTAGRSKTHVLAMLICYPGPTSVLRGPGLARAELAGTDSCWGWGSERTFVKSLPWTFDESQTLDAEVGRRLVTARRSGRSWFVAGMSGAEPERVRLKCGFLTPGVTYRMALWKDDLKDDSICRKAKREIRTVNASDIIPIALAASGGFLAQFEPAGNPAQPDEDDDRFVDKGNRHLEPELHVVGERDRVTTNATRTVIVRSNALEVMFSLNGRLWGAQVPNKAKTCIWRDVPLQKGENTLEFKGGPITRRIKLRRE